jgi:hypothetical protein
VNRRIDHGHGHDHDCDHDPGTVSTPIRVGADPTPEEGP